MPRTRGQRDRDAGTHHRPLARWQHHIASGDQVGPGVTGVSVSGHRNLRIQPGQQDLNGTQLIRGHGRRDYPQAGVRPSSPRPTLRRHAGLR